MKFLLSLAMKNLRRHTRRTLITASAIAVGLGFFILIDSMLEGVGRESEQNMILYETASARIVDKEFWEDKDKMPLKHSIENPGPYLEQLEEMGIDAAPRISFSGELVVQKDPFPEDGSIQIKAIGIDPERDPEVYKLSTAVAAGRFLKSDDLGVLLGGWLAEDLGAEVGYPVSIVCRTKEGYFQTIDVEVIGIVNTPNPMVNRSQLFLPIEAADYFLQMDGAVTQIDLSLPMNGDIERRLNKIREPLMSGNEEHQLISWKIIGADYVALAATKTGASKMIVFLVFIIAAVGISNTMLMAIYERIRELGMMRALGMKDSEVRTAFLLEAAGIGLIGSIIGVLFGILMNIPMVELGIDFSFIMRDMDMGYRITGMMRGIWNIRTIISAFFMGLIISVVVAFLPTRRALKKEITECLRYE